MSKEIEKRLKDRGHTNPKAGIEQMGLPYYEPDDEGMTPAELREKHKDKSWASSIDDDGDIFHPDEIHAGDYVHFGSYGRLFVLRAPMEGSLWVTDRRADRYDPNAAGWYIRRNLAKKILEEA